MDCGNCKNYYLEHDHTPGFKGKEERCKGDFMDLKGFVCPGFEKGKPEIIDINPEEDPNYHGEGMDKEE